jgi:hypothetical protein
LPARSSRVVSDEQASLAHEISDSTVTTDDGQSQDGQSQDGQSQDGQSQDGQSQDGSFNNKFTIN